MATIILNHKAYRSAALHGASMQDATEYDIGVTRVYAEMCKAAFLAGYTMQIDWNSTDGRSTRVIDEDSEADYREAQEWANDKLDFWTYY